jgi:DNA-directed RNA polymerase subunit RPC12/RpoP
MAFYAYQEKFGEKPPWAWKNDPAIEPDDKTKRWFKYYRIKQAKAFARSARTPKSCRHCGSTHLVKARGTGPHAAALRCGGCKRHLKWLSKDQANA